MSFKTFNLWKSFFIHIYVGYVVALPCSRVCLTLSCSIFVSKSIVLFGWKPSVSWPRPPLSLHSMGKSRRLIPLTVYTLMYIPLSESLSS